MENKNYRVGVIGGGAWGTALSIMANRAGSAVMLGTRNKHVIQSIEERRNNDIYLPSVFIDPDIIVHDRFGDICRNDIVIISVPSHVMRSCCIAISDLLANDVPLLLASKGVERGSLLLMSEVVQA